MTRRAPGRPVSRSATEQHRAWLELVDREGPFVAIPALKRVWPQGVGSISANSLAALRDAKPDFDRAWDRWRSGSDDDPALENYRGARDKWVHTVLQDVAGWDVHLGWDAESFPDGRRPAATSPNHAVTVEATGGFFRNGDVYALVLVVDPVDSLRDAADDLWSASPIDRMDALLRESGVPVGVVTDGRWWAVVSAQPDMMTASGIVDSQTWIEERDTRDAFFALIEPVRLAGGKESDRLPALFKESVTAAEEITVALGTQVRRAVELLVTALSESAQEEREHGRPDPLPADRDVVYEAAVTAMMRVVFLLFAEERSLMPQSALFTEGYGISGELDALDARAREEGSEALDATYHAWHRLLATSQALYSGVSTEDMRLPAYGGSLFDAERFTFLTARDDRGVLAVTVSDRVMLEVLRSVQYAAVRGEHRRISFRDVDVEQIGYIYEGLLGYTARDVDKVTVGLIGQEGAEPEIPLDELEDLYEGNPDDAELIAAVLAWIKANQPAAVAKSATAMKKALQSGDTMEDADRALLSVTRDQELLDRLRPYIGIIRRDLRNRPVVIQPGGLAVVETPSRANSGAHYTPKSLAREVVQHALEPLVYQPGPHQTADQSQWRLIKSYEILDLKVADIACGSGAFLVAAAEYLAERLVEAWHAEGAAQGSPHELDIRARRYVVANCLYGADINGMAVEMCKLSLWLVSLDPKLPFSFVDDKVLHGNSLLGITDVKQLEALHIDPSQSKTFTSDRLHYSAGALFGEGSEATGIEMLDVRGVLRRAIDLRKRLADPVDDSDPQRSAEAKRRLWRDYQKLTETLSKVADGVIAAGLRLGGKPGRALNEAYDNLRIAVDRAYTHGGAKDSTMLEGIIEVGLTPTVQTDYDRWKPLHWALAVPDVMERGGFSAVIGNPPFLGAKKVSPALGSSIREWLVNVLASGSKGNADLVAYFFLRAVALLDQRGTVGLIATNTIAQGDTREVGLERMVASGFTVTRAIQSRPWPAASANLEYAAAWGTRGPVDDDAPRTSDGVRVRSISTLLEPSGRAFGAPIRLAENKGIAFQGCITLGTGFLISPEEANRWISSDRRNSSVLLPYLNGEDLNQRSRGGTARWVIDFSGLTEEEVQRFPLPYQRVHDDVRPGRLSSKDLAVREYPWWLFWRIGPALRRAIRPLDEVLAIARVSKALMPVRVTTGHVFSDATVVFATSSFADQALLSSSLHQLWAIKYGTTMRVDPTYRPSTVFETFTRPAAYANLAGIGKKLDAERREMMTRRDLGLTSLYNLVNDPEVIEDPDVARLREIHVEIDKAVMAAYRWDDVPLDHGFYTYRQMERWTVSPSARVEILDRLLEENHRRAALQGDAFPKSSTTGDGGDEE